MRFAWKPVGAGSIPRRLTQYDSKLGRQSPSQGLVQSLVDEPATSQRRAGNQ